MVQGSWILGAASLVLGAGIWIVFGSHLPPQVPLFYSRPWGEEQLGSPVWLFLPLGMTVLIAISSYTLARLIGEDKVLAALVLTSLMVVQSILTLGLLRIVLLVI